MSPGDKMTDLRWKFNNRIKVDFFKMCLYDLLKYPVKAKQYYNENSIYPNLKYSNVQSKITCKYKLNEDKTKSEFPPALFGNRQNHTSLTGSGRRFPLYVARTSVFM